MTHLYEVSTSKIPPTLFRIECGHCKCPVLMKDKIICYLQNMIKTQQCVFSESP